MHTLHKYDNIFPMSTDVFLLRTQKGRYFFMEEKSKYFVVKQKAVPEVLLKDVYKRQALWRWITDTLRRERTVRHRFPVSSQPEM